MIYWLTGLPGSGKTTLALALKRELEIRGRVVSHIDGEWLRGLMKNDDFTSEGRVRNIRAGQALSRKLHEDGITVIASFVSPYLSLRERFKEGGNVLEVYVHTTAVRGKENHFPLCYEPPQRYFVDIDTTQDSIETCVGKILGQ